ncbi:MAG: hypothetical protein ACFWT6_04220 [Virgibacillus proomii]|jgi:hypothetical protein
MVAKHAVSQGMRKATAAVLRGFLRTPAKVVFDLLIHG